MTRRVSPFLTDPSVRPFVVLAIIVIVLGIADGHRGRVLAVSTTYSVLQQFATIGPVALGLGLSMMVGEFDLSVGGTLTLAGCVAVMAGQTNPFAGLLLALAVGSVAGLVQGLIMAWLNLSSIGVTLGGLLTFGGLSYLLTANTTIAYERIDVAMAVNLPLLGIFSVRSLTTILLYLAAAFIVSWTRLGRDLLAVGSDRRAAVIVGIRANSIVVTVFTISGAVTAIGGGLLSYGLAAASPVALADALVPGAAAAILGGVSLSGGKGRPLGIAGGVLVLSMLRSGLTAIGVPPFAHWIVTAGVLFAVAVLDSGELGRRIYPIRHAVVKHQGLPLQTDR
jgi:ribose/xylose/arabinose/galactoside ABC-type transport system permease subunit